jgi:hypothetical protein
MSVKRRKYGTGHAYYVTDVSDPRPEDWIKWPGVTTIIGETVPKKLTDWAARMAADEAIDFWNELSRLRLHERHERLHYAYRRDRDKAARRGTEVHRIAEKLVAFEEVTKPDELAGHIEAYVDFLDRIQPQPVHVELLVVNHTLRYCGTADLVADLPEVTAEEIIPPGRWLLELKTSQGLYPESALQATGYVRAETYVTDPRGSGEELPLADLGIEHCGVVHIRSDSWALHPVDTGEDTWAYFQRLRWLYDRKDSLEALIGPAVAVPMLADVT